MRRLLIGLSAVALLASAQPGGAEEPTEVVFESTGPFDTQVVWDCAGTEVGGGLAALSSGLACSGSNDLPAVVPPMAATSSTSISADGAMAASVNVSGGTPATTLAAGAWVEAGSSWSVTGQFHAVRFLVEFTSNQPFYGYDFNPVVQTGNDVARALAQTEPLQNYSDFGVGGTTGDAHGPGGPCSDGTSPRFEPTFGPPGDGSTQVQGLRVFCSDPDAVMGGPTSRTLVGAGVGTAAFARSTYLTSYDEKATGRLLKATVIIER